MSPITYEEKKVDTIKEEGPRKHSTSSSSTVAKDEEEEDRGRKPERDDSPTAKAEDAQSGDEQKSITGKEKGGRKRKRSRKGLDKKYLCPHEGCGKSYSRAEHLYRHQLNRELYTILLLSETILTTCFRYSKTNLQM